MLLALNKLPSHLRAEKQPNISLSHTGNLESSVSLDCRRIAEFQEDAHTGIDLIFMAKTFTFALPTCTRTIFLDHIKRYIFKILYSSHPSEPVCVMYLCLSVLLFYIFQCRILTKRVPVNISNPLNVNKPNCLVLKHGC